MAFIKFITYHLPSRIVTNDELTMNYMAAKDGNAMKAMGVDSRAWAADSETSGDLAVLAGKKLFAESGFSPNEVDFVIFCSQGMDYFMPSTSCIIQDRLGIPTTAGAFGMDLGCSGFVYGLAVANSFVDSGLAQNVLLLTADTLSKHINPNDKNILLFGDAASATLISENGFAKIGKFDLGTDGSGYEDIIIRNGAWRHHTLTGREWSDDSGNVHRDDWFDMDGEAVFNFTVDHIPSMIDACLRKNDINKNDIDYYVFHQPNRYILNTLRKLNDIQKEKFFVDLSDTGNTTSSTVPIGLVKSIRNKNIQSGMNVMIAGFGVGLSWASTILSIN